MKNLNLLKNLCFQIDELDHCEHFTFGVNDANSPFYASPPVYFCENGIIYYYNPVTRQKLLVFNLKTYYETYNQPKLVDLVFHHISQSLIAFEERGDVLNIPVTEVESFSTESVECVGTVECGIKAVSWSPDEGIVVLITNEDKLILMSETFDLISEVDLLNVAPADEFISVGWGKKETQFHGSEGKRAAKQVASIVSTDPTFDDRRIRISWRGDSLLFAISYFCTSKNTRSIKIFNSEGVLKSISEPVGGLEESLAWRPSGNLIATTCALPNKYIVAFFEKNGLKHGDFNLPENIKVKDLFWNSDSTILSALCSDTSCSEDTILLWSVNNYHWYLKQKLTYDSKITLLKWDVQNSYRMYVLLYDSTVITYDWIFSVDQSENFTSESEAFVSVIDGTNLLLTPFKKFVIPPPMCKHLLDVPCPVNSVSFIKDTRNGGNVNDICIFCIDKMYICTYNIGSSQHELKDLYEYPNDTEKILHHWLWISSKQFCCVGSNKKLENIFHFLEIEDNRLKVRHSTVLENAVFTLTKKENDVLIQLEDGRLFIFCIDRLKIEPFSFASLPEPCSQLIYSTNLFALSLTHRLYVCDRLIFTGVTSVHFQKPFLLATTTQHRLLICESHSQNVCEEISLRNTERGALLVTTTGLSVILQIPRGNLETIQPRAITLLNAGKLLDARDYLGAMRLLRKQRIDLNLMVDHNPHVFLQNIPEFVKQMEDVSWVSLFISELHNDDSTKGIYAAYYKKTNPLALPLVNKVNTVCRALCDEMNSRSVDNFCHPILGTYVKTNQMVKALTLAQTDKALKHLLFLVDIDTLYETALAIYDLEMALKIASKSQKDPKEYVPFLNLLRNLEPNYRKFTIDKQLRKYECAIQNLAACEDKFGELETFMVEFSLYSTAIKLFPTEDPRYKKVARKYADYLLSKRSYEEAGFMFEESNCLDDAVLAYCKAGLWKECLTLAKRLNYDKDKINPLLSALIKQLKSMRNYADAGFICIHYLQDVTLSVEIYLQGLMFSDAVYIAESHNMSELINKIIEPCIKDVAVNMQEDINKDRDKFNKYLTRLKQVRIDKQNDTNHEPDFLSDIHSETSSVSSFNTSNASSHSSRSSCKSARKQQRKLWSLKEGNPREEISLVSALSQLIEVNYKLTKDVHEICRFLLKFKESTKAKQLQESLAELLKLMKDNQSAVWPALNTEENELVSVEDAMLKYPPVVQVNKSWELSILN